MPGELTLNEIKKLAGELAGFGLKHIVYSGGEPLLRRDFKEICGVFKSYGVKQTLLTNGLLLEKKYETLSEYFHEIVISLDGAKAETHNRIRGLNSFDLILKGMEKVVKQKDKSQVISIRSVLQKQNFRELPDFIEMAKSVNVNRISFLAADVTSDAFGREHGVGTAVQDSNIVPDKNETAEFRQIIKELTGDYKEEFENRFISESPQKLMKIVEYYEALNGSNKFPVNYCNAPMMSAVITSTGNVHPCYFLPSIGNIRRNPITELINFPSIKETRKKVKSFEMERCKTCVCTLNVNARAALAGRF